MLSGVDSPWRRRRVAEFQAARTARALRTDGVTNSGSDRSSLAPADARIHPSAGQDDVRVGGQLRQLQQRAHEDPAAHDGEG